MGRTQGDLFIAGVNIDPDDRRIMDDFIYPENELNRWDRLYRTINLPTQS